MKADKILLRTVLYLHHRLERAVKRGTLPLSLNQYRLLLMIQEGPARSVELATASEMTKPSIGSMVSVFEENGWIDRVEDMEDKRAASIRITPAGRKVVREFEEALQGALQHFLGKDIVGKADTELQWLFDVWNTKRDEAHNQWALRKAK